ncbi:aldo/keto reductase [Virgibacillus sp. YIM 98842]|uniref:aldo/keto reductase n=1 Tax=Virgibacillus sp. YIM 98842 TaxID=2663533 RepID=UPI0013DA1C2E|nr:aldo/keto reductase [Virgibacillus sp. YIM 98842]
MITHLQDTITLNNGVRMPGFGLGVYKVEDGDVVYQAVNTALETGYRSIDTASYYFNEKGVGQAVKDSRVPRDDIFITSKVWNDQQGYENTLKAFEESLENLQTDYLDLYLIHWPVKGMYKETWRALEKLYKDERVKAIGVSNFHIHHLQHLMDGCEVKPAVDQVEYHPHLTQEELHAFCRREGIQLEAWSPLKRGQLLDEPVLEEIGEKYNKTAAQVILRWDVQNKVITIPKTITDKRIEENADIFDFSLTEDEMKQIQGLNKNDRAGTNPESFD